MKRILLVITAILISGTFVSGQSVLTFIKTDWDSNYVQRYVSKWSGRLYAVSKDQSFILSNRENGDEISFHPNSKAAVGLGVSYGNYALDLGVAISNKKNDPNHETKSIDVISGLYTGQHLFDFSFQWYAGFFSSYHIPDTDSTNELFRNDIRTFNIGINYSYNFNYRRFSFNAPFIGTQIQKKSAGAPVAGVFITYYDLRANQSIIPSHAEDEFNAEAELSEANLLTAGFFGGYAYTFCLPAHFTITLSLMPGLSFNIGDVKTEDYYAIGHPFTVSPKLISKNGIGYGGRKFYGLFSYMYDGNFVNMGHKNQLNYNLSKIKFLVGYRID